MGRVGGLGGYLWNQRLGGRGLMEALAGVEQRHLLSNVRLTESKKLFGIFGFSNPISCISPKNTFFFYKVSRLYLELKV